MKILVTGANGFVGTHLFRELEANGYSVYVTDLDGDCEPADLAIPGEAERIIEWAAPDYVVHLAARYGRLLCADEPHRAVTDNASATTELAAACARRGISVLYTSSSEVYGDHGEDTITEDSELRTPTTIYGLSKLWGEQTLRLYLPPENLCIVRLNMLYGEGQRGGYGLCALATFVKKAVTGESYTVHRDASRSWLHVSDAVRALRLFIEGGHAGTFNLGNPAPPVTMTALAEMVGGKYEMAVAPPGQIRHKRYDCLRALNTIDWFPGVSLEDGLARTRAWAEREYSVVT